MLHISGLEDLIANSMDILEPAPVDNKGNHREDGKALQFLAYYKCAGLTVAICRV